MKRIAVGTSRPLREPAAIARLLRERIDGLGEDGLDTGYGFDVDPPRRARGRDRCDPARTISWRPRTAGRRPTSPTSSTGSAPGSGCGGCCGSRPRHPYPRIRRRGAAGRPREHRAVPGCAARACPTTCPCRPIRLFERPEPIEAIAAVPDGPPVRFRWRRVLHEIAAIEGPERIAPEWWKAAAAGLTRDYFRAEDRDGRRFWLFREGLFGRETAKPAGRAGILHGAASAEDPGLHADDAHLSPN